MCQLTVREIIICKTLLLLIAGKTHIYTQFQLFVTHQHMAKFLFFNYVTEDN